jgi:hypothetical protein
MMVTDIFHERHLPVHKTSIVTARGAVVVSGPAVSKKKFQNRIKFHSYLPTLFFFAMLSETNNLFIFFLPNAHISASKR